MREARARPRGFLLADLSAHFIEPRRCQLLRIKGRAAGEQFVEQHAERVDVGAGVDVQSAHLRLLRTHVGGRAHELIKGGEQGFVREPLIVRGLGQAEINHLGHRHVVVLRDENVRRFEVAMDDAFLVRVLDGLADLREQFEPLVG